MPYCIATQKPLSHIPHLANIFLLHFRISLSSCPSHSSPSYFSSHKVKIMAGNIKSMLRPLISSLQTCHEGGPWRAIQLAISIICVHSYPSYILYANSLKSVQYLKYCTKSTAAVYWLCAESASSDSLPGTLMVKVQRCPSGTETPICHVQHSESSHRQDILLCVATKGDAGQHTTTLCCFSSPSSPSYALQYLISILLMWLSHLLDDVAKHFTLATKTCVTIYLPAAMRDSKTAQTTETTLTYRILSGGGTIAKLMM